MSSRRPVYRRKKFSVYADRDPILSDIVVPKAKTISKYQDEYESGNQFPSKEVELESDQESHETSVELLKQQNIHQNFAEMKTDISSTNTKKSLNPFKYQYLVSSKRKRSNQIKKTNALKDVSNNNNMLVKPTAGINPLKVKGKVSKTAKKQEKLLNMKKEHRLQLESRGIIFEESKVKEDQAINQTEIASHKEEQFRSIVSPITNVKIVDRIKFLDDDKLDQERIDQVLNKNRSMKTKLANQISKYPNNNPTQSKKRLRDDSDSDDCVADSFTQSNKRAKINLNSKSSKKLQDIFGSNSSEAENPPLVAQVAPKKMDIDEKINVKVKDNKIKVKSIHRPIDNTPSSPNRMHPQTLINNKNETKSELGSEDMDISDTQSSKIDFVLTSLPRATSTPTDSMISPITKKNTKDIPMTSQICKQALKGKSAEELDSDDYQSFNLTEEINKISAYVGQAVVTSKLKDNTRKKIVKNDSKIKSKENPTTQKEKEEEEEISGFNDSAEKITVQVPGKKLIKRRPLSKRIGTIQKREKAAEPKSSIKSAIKSVINQAKTKEKNKSSNKVKSKAKPKPTFSFRSLRSHTKEHGYSEFLADCSGSDPLNILAK